jgi:hypothetical protein
MNPSADSGAENDLCVTRVGRSERDAMKAGGFGGCSDCENSSVSKQSIVNEVSSKPQSAMTREPRSRLKDTINVPLITHNRNSMNTKCVRLYDSVVVLCCCRCCSRLCWLA